MSAPQRVVVVGASAGGVEALRDFVANLPADLPATVCVVLHIPANAPTALPGILDRSGPLPAIPARDGDPLQAGVIVVASSDRHLLVGESEVAVSRGPRENGHRPAVDVLFRTAARWWGPRALAVVLSGSLDDGAAGALAVADRGGTVFVHDPALAHYPGMPRAALAAVPAATTGTPAQLAKLVADACRAAAAAAAPVDERLEVETAMAFLDEEAHARTERPGRPAGVACPDCGGAMFELDHEAMVRFRCRVGHAWSPESLITQQVEDTEAALWTAIRTMEEGAAVQRKLAGRTTGAVQAHHDERAAEADASAAAIRALLRDGART
ncbi:MAG TPA: chemotaxis protein CheB [Sporichthya sp.]|nr:chemotaxis protein CheB [Sporichthya sp.]